jgi:hypothetical protein
MSPQLKKKYFGMKNTNFVTRGAELVACQFNKSKTTIKVLNFKCDVSSSTDPTTQLYITWINRNIFAELRTVLK